MNIKNERIELLKQQLDIVGKVDEVPEAVKELGYKIDELQQNTQALQIATYLDPLTGKMTFGAINSPTILTQHRGNTLKYINEKKYDLAVLEIEQIEKIHPSFTGSIYLHFLIDKAKGLQDDAAKYANQVIQEIPTDTRILDVYVFMITYYLSQDNRKDAEDVALKAVNIWNDNQKLLESFKKWFGYTPTIQ